MNPTCTNEFREPDLNSEAMKRIKNALRAYSHAGEMRRRRPPEFAFSDSSGAQPAVYYLTPDDNTPRGGIRVMYRHVDLLNANGIDAKVLHTKPGFRCTWFTNTSTVVSVGEVRLTPADLLVVPDYYAPGQHAIHMMHQIPSRAAVAQN